MKLLLTFCFVCVLACVAGAADGQPGARVDEVTFCQLMKEPMAFVGKRIRIRAIYDYGFEVGFLRSPACCPERGPDVGVTFDPDMDGHSDAILHKLDKKGAGAALAVFVGRLDRVKNVSSRLPSGDRIELTVGRIEKVEKSERRQQGRNPAWVPSNCGAKSAAAESRDNQ